MDDTVKTPWTPDQKWPQTIWIVRHGQSAGNVARDAAEAAGLPLIDIMTRDVDTPLSDLGREQAQALGRWFGEMREDQQPTVVLCSPYVRARETAYIVLESAGPPLDSLTFNTDERLREKEFGILDRLTKHGIRQKYPELSDQRTHVGKFYFRPPGGESWCDVILRLRNVIDTITREYRRERVLIIAHQGAKQRDALLESGPIDAARRRNGAFARLGQGCGCSEFGGRGARCRTRVASLRRAQRCGHDIAAPDGRVWRHESQNIGLATSGSGDVLSGIIAGLFARRAPFEQASAWGVALHAQAGSKLAERYGPLGYLARELAAEVPALMAALSS